MNRFSLFSSPIYWVSLLVLICNDLLLKSFYPGFVTGKLSDFAGLVVLPLFLFGLFPRPFQTTKGKILLLVGSGAILVLLQLPSFLHAYDYILAALHLPPHNLTPDLTDLVALAVLPLVFLFMRKTDLGDKGSSKCRKLIPVRHFVLGSLSLFALCATSFVGQKTIALNRNVSSSAHKSEALFLIQKKMNSDSIETLVNRVRDDSLYFLSVKFDDYLWHKSKDGLFRSSSTIDGELRFVIDSKLDSLRLKELKLLTWGYHIEDSTVARIYKNRFMPLMTID